MVHTSYQVFRPFALENQGEEIVKKRFFFFLCLLVFLTLKKIRFCEKFEYSMLAC